jgi:Ca2+-binding RTX toxin-like protein
MRPARNPTIAFCLSVLLTAVSLPAIHAETATGSDDVTCTYREAGKPGPADNALDILAADFTDAIDIYRDGDAIRVFQVASSFSASGAEEIHCDGTAPTVTNIDSIQIDSGPGRYVPAVFIDESGRRIAGWPPDQVLADSSGGPFGPGATPEKHGSEIEIHIASMGSPRDGRQITFLPGPGSAAVTAGSVGKHGRTVALNLDSGLDGRTPDADVTVTDTSIVVLKGTAGDDFLSGAGDPGVSLPLRAGLSLFGFDGDDVLLGHPGRDRIDAGAGDDLLRGGRGDDGSPSDSGGLGLYDGTGNDRVYGGPGDDELGSADKSGHDQLFGGPGADTFHEHDRAKDRLECGPGVENDVQFDHGLDRLRGCEPSARE